MASKFFIFLAFSCFLISGGMPVYENSIGIVFILVSFATLPLFFIYPPMGIFPIVGCVCFIFAFKNYFIKENYNKSKTFAIVAFVFMTICLSFALINGHLKLGILIWFLSSIFLLLGIYLENIKEEYAKFICIGSMSCFIAFGYSLYYFETYNSQYRYDKYKKIIGVAIS